MLEKQLTAVSAAVVKLSKTSLEGAGSKDAAVAAAIAAVQESADDAIVATKEGTVATVEKYVGEIVVKIAAVEVAVKELDDFVAARRTREGARGISTSQLDLRRGTVTMSSRCRMETCRSY